MKQITFTHEEVLRDFCRCPLEFSSDEYEQLHRDMIEAIGTGKVEVDKKADFQVLNHWVTTEFEISQFNFNTLDVSIRYSVHESGKYSKVLFTLKR